MGFMASEVYDALIEAGASEAKARAAAEIIPISNELATKADIAEIKVFVMKAGLTIAGLAVLLNRFLDWVIPLEGVMLSGS